MLKLYFTPSYEGRDSYWWTQRNESGYCFEIRKRMDGGFNVIVVDVGIFAVVDNFHKAEMALKEAEKSYERR